MENLKRDLSIDTLISMKVEVDEELVDKINKYLDSGHSRIIIKKGENDEQETAATGPISTGEYVTEYKKILRKDEKGKSRRLIKHSSCPNLDPCIWIKDDKLHVIFFASKDINKNEKVFFDYGHLIMMLHEWKFEEKSEDAGRSVDFSEIVDTSGDLSND